MKTTQHTPGLPELAARFFYDESDGTIRCKWPNHEPGISIARMTCFGAHDVYVAKNAIGELIVTACNAHYELWRRAEWP